VRGNKVARVPVKLGFLDGGWAEIREGVKLGDQVVIAGKTALRDGSVVQILNAPDAKASVAATETAAPKAPAAKKQ